MQRSWKVYNAHTGLPGVFLFCKPHGACVDPAGVCPTRRWCVHLGSYPIDPYGFGDANGKILIARNPAEPGSKWTKRTIDPNGKLYGLACPSVRLCIAVDASGSILTSTSPTGNAKSWQTARVDAAGLSGISCPSTSYCVAVDDRGRAITGTAPRQLRQQARAVNNAATAAANVNTIAGTIRDPANPIVSSARRTRAK